MKWCAVKTKSLSQVIQPMSLDETGQVAMISNIGLSLVFVFVMTLETTSSLLSILIFIENLYVDPSFRHWVVRLKARLSCPAVRFFVEEYLFPASSSSIPIVFVLMVFRFISECLLEGNYAICMRFDTTAQNHPNHFGFVFLLGFYSITKNISFYIFVAHNPK